MPSLTVRNLHLFRGEAARLDGLSLAVGPGEIACLIGGGDSGAGLLLRTLRGRYRPDGGRIFVGSRDVTDLPGRRRGFSAWPPLPGAAPGVILLGDPPFPADPAGRAACRAKTRQLVREAGHAVLCATADIAAALSIADRLYVLEAGRIAQEGPPEEVYRAPRSRRIAELVGPANLIPGEVLGEAEPGLWLVRTPLGELSVTGMEPQARHVTLCWRPERALEGEGFANTLTGILTGRVFHGPLTELELDLGGLAQRLLLPRAAVAEGAPVTFHVAPEDLAFLDPAA
ncbi:TOBE domain-containing protein [Poseidonocella sp. HB161398]|uniref:TOBE domain-containing protein n=1 Tax=Poseidonocella sp. HB161398 TaxID=2320855 RepID=UPI001108ADEB|nr:TOBE domain-containing protein [Poseidonocella sp. HB161398]